MEHESHEPPAPVPASPWALPATGSRHDGWTGERMAAFCETLADTGLVVDACLAATKSTNAAYALRRRNPLFAAAWEAALTIARERLADTLLARSIEGTVEQYYKDGELVGERRVIDSRLGLAILRRLDKLADPDPQSPVRAERSRSAPAARSQPLDWDLAISALQSADDDAVAEALAMLAGGEGNKVHETHDPPNSPGEGDTCVAGDDEEDEGIDLSDRCWSRDEMGEKVWMTDFPPPAGFTAYQNRPYDEDQDIEPYERECTPGEVALLEGSEAAGRAFERAEQEQLRDAWFKMLEAEGGEASEAKQPHSELEPASETSRAPEVE